MEKPVPFFLHQHPVSFTFRFPLVHFLSSRQPNLYDGRISGGSLFKLEPVEWVNNEISRSRVFYHSIWVMIISHYMRSPLLPAPLYIMSNFFEE